MDRRVFTIEDDEAVSFAPMVAYGVLNIASPSSGSLQNSVSFYAAGTPQADEARGNGSLGPIEPVIPEVLELVAGAQLEEEDDGNEPGRDKGAPMGQRAPGEMGRNTDAGGGKGGEQQCCLAQRKALGLIEP